ncbi:hypothetical protein [Actinomadura soli]|uniref:hypothetical protein n=1 Tax=Actinomadura soli TaxID=2508997 RepID=UPI00197A815C|nr:hypothetical protein [Actinomadura soli]
MSGDHHTNHPVHGTAAGDAYVALPPTAVDATASGPTRLIVAWPGFDPPRTASALAAAIPMTGVPVWRVYLDLPGRSPGGLGSGAILETGTIEAYCAAVESAVERLPAALADIRRDLGLPNDPDDPDDPDHPGGSVGLAGFSAGGAVALLAVARGIVPVSALALVAPVVAPSRVARAVEKRSGRDRTWTDAAAALADRLDLGSLAADLAGRDVATLLIGGAKDRVVPAREITSLRDLLRRHGAGPVESATFRMGHALAAEPGTEARPPITEAVRVDGVLTDWFRDRLACPTPLPEDDAPAELASHQAAPQPTGSEPLDTARVDTQPIRVRPVSGITVLAQPQAVHQVDASPAETQQPDVPSQAAAQTADLVQEPDAAQADAEAQPDKTQAASAQPLAGGDGAWSSNTQDTESVTQNTDAGTQKADVGTREADVEPQEADVEAQSAGTPSAAPACGLGRAR